MNQVFICRFCGISFIPKDKHKNRPHLFCSPKCVGLNKSSQGRKTNKEYYDKHFSIPGNREKKRIKDREYSARNREQLRVKAHEYFLANKFEVNRKQRKYAEKNKEKKKAYNLANKDRIRKNHAKWCKKQRDKNPTYRLHDNLTSNIKNSLRIGKNGERTEKILGYSITTLKKHLEKLFTKGMTWENYGEWHLEHKIPISVHNFTKPEHEDFKKCWALKNLQPMWAHDNYVKHNKLTKHFQPSLLL